MIITEKAERVIKWTARIIGVALIAATIWLSVACFNKNQIIKEQDTKIFALTEQVECLKEENRALGAEDCITVTCNFNMTQKNVFSLSQTNCQNIARDISKMTRKEIYDSLYVAKWKGTLRGDLKEKELQQNKSEK